MVTYNDNLNLLLSYDNLVNAMFRAFAYHLSIRICLYESLLIKKVVITWAQTGMDIKLNRYFYLIYYVIY